MTAMAAKMRDSILTWVLFTFPLEIYELHKVEMHFIVRGITLLNNMPVLLRHAGTFPRRSLLENIHIFLNPALFRYM